jgi:predicted flap endonuclease-1-like 5' DNA nuclease
MAIEGINSNQVATAQAAITPPKPEATTTPAPAKTADVTNKPYVVELTGTALAKSLKLSGQNPAQIALKMGLDIKTVDQYLGVTATPAPAPPVTTAPAAPTAAPQTKQTAPVATPTAQPQQKK